MKSKISFFALIMCIVLVFSCASTPSDQSSSAVSGSSVWKINRDGNTLFLGGSIHMLRDKDFPLPKEFDLAFSNSTALVLETDIEQMETEEVVLYLMSQIFLSDGQTIHSLLDSEAYDLLMTKTSKYGFSVDDVGTLKPSMVINMLTVFQIQELGFSQEGIDLFYLNKAKNQNMPIYFLESVFTQIDMLVSMGEGYESDFVRYSLQDMDSTEEMLDLLVSEWRIGEPVSTVEMLEEMKEDWLPVYKSMIVDRNNAWMPQIEECINSGSVFFVVVGLAHLHGPDGLLKLLEDAGCTIEQL